MFWYPWGREALERAKAENKPILLSIGYSTCYWCHVMEREVFENLSIASLMNKFFINVKVDREERPDLDEIYMVARQLITKEGGWPNNVFLTPELEPFYAGGTYAPDESSGRPSFPRLLEWLNHEWLTQESSVRQGARDIAATVKNYLTFKAEGEATSNIVGQAAQLVDLLKQHHDTRAGGFFHGPKFPHECYLDFLLAYHEQTGDASALDMAAFSLGKMASGGIYDQVGCGFHRYAVDREWYVPHFEKMLYNQAMLARTYADAFRITKNPFFADIAKGILDFAGGPLTDGGGAFYAAIDAETDGVEGAYYAWTAKEIESLLAPEEAQFMMTFYALADIPAFPGHKHTDGQALILRKPLPEAAAEKDMNYAQLSAMAGQVMNKLLAARNKRTPPNLDNKIIAAWNGLMIDACARAGKIFSEKKYIAMAKKAADYVLERGLDNDGNLLRIIAAGDAPIEATLEDYAYLIQGLLSLHAAGENSYLEPAIALLARVEELFSDSAAPGYFYTKDAGDLLVRIKSGDDATLPGPNAVMMENLIALHGITGDKVYKERAEKIAAFFLDGNNRVLIEFATMIKGAMKLQPAASAEDVAVTATLKGNEVIVTLDIRPGWHINANPASQPFLIPTSIDVQGEGVEVVQVKYPPPKQKAVADGAKLHLYEGRVEIRVLLKLPKTRPDMKLLVGYQPCSGSACHAERNLAIAL